MPADGDAANGDAMPAEGDAEGTKNIVDMVLENPDFSILVEAALAADETAEEDMKLVPLFGADDKSVTVFAPNNAAIEATLAELGITAEDLLSDPDRLRSILQYHVVADDGDESGMDAPV